SSFVFFFSSRRRHTRSKRDWSSDVCSSDLAPASPARRPPPASRSRRPPVRPATSASLPFLQGGSQPHVIGASHPDLDQLLHQVGSLPPQIQRCHFLRPTLGELPVDHRDAVLERRGQRRFPSGHHPPVAVDLLQRGLERRRPLLR